MRKKPRESPAKIANGAADYRGKTLSARTTAPSLQPSPKRRGSKAKTPAASGRQNISRPFPTAIVKQAALVAEQYQVILEHSEGHWYGRGLEMPQVFGDGATPGQCVEATRAALRAAVAYLLEQDRVPPAPARSGRRTQQVNVRLTAEEKTALEGIARRRGFQGLSDYLRAAALEATE